MEIIQSNKFKNLKVPGDGASVNPAPCLRGVRLVRRKARTSIKES